MFGNLVIRTASLNVTLYFCNAFATKYGDEFIAAYTIAINLWFLVAFIIDGYSSAGQYFPENCMVKNHMVYL